MTNWNYYLFNITYNFSNLFLGELFEFFHLNRIEKYFYVRYNDNNFPSIRIRINTSETKNNSFFSFLKQKENEGHIWNVSIKKYNREINRYSVISFTNIEKIFCLDSFVVMRLLNEYDYIDEVSELLIGVKFIHDFFDILEIDINERISIIQGPIKSIEREFNIQNSYKKFIFKLQRNNVISLDFLFDENKIFDNYNFLPYLKYTNLRKDILSKTDVSIFNINKNAILLINHMTLNKLYNKSQKLYEFSIYNLLLLQYKKFSFKTQVENN